jgi:hypothetical protein
VGYRRGDSAEVAQIELVGSEWTPKAEPEATEKEAPKKTKGVGDRLRQAARRIRADASGGSKAQAKGQTQGASRKTSTPRKAGGS